MNTRGWIHFPYVCAQEIGLFRTCQRVCVSQVSYTNTAHLVSQLNIVTRRRSAFYLNYFQTSSCTQHKQNAGRGNENTRLTFNMITWMPLNKAAMAHLG